MSRAAASSASPSYGSNRVLRALGHRATALLIAAIVGVIVVGLVPPPGVFGLLTPLLLFSFVIVCWMALRDHDRRLCERCVHAMPLNPSEKAVRYQRRFWTAHTGAEPRFMIPYLVVLIGSNFATTPAGRIGWAVIQLSMVWLILSYSSHRKLQPWCPWCSGGGGGEEVDETPPVIPHDDHQLI